MRPLEAGGNFTKFMLRLKREIVFVVHSSSHALFVVVFVVVFVVIVVLC
jgi:hypothetical protein